MDRVINQTLALKPGGCPPLQSCGCAWVPLFQASTQQIGEQVVIAVPPALIVHRQQEQVGRFQVLEHVLGLSLDQCRRRCGLLLICSSPICEDRSAEGAAQALENRGLQHERFDVGWLVREDFFDQVVEDIAIAASEGCDETCHVVAALGASPGRTRRGQAERRHLQAGCPAFGACLQFGAVSGIQQDTGPPVHECGDLVQTEAQVVSSDECQLATCTEARKWQGRIAACGNNQVNVRWKVVKQEADPVVDDTGANELIVIQHEHDGIGEFDQLVEQVRQQGRPGRRLRRFESLQECLPWQLLPAIRLQRLQGRDNVGPEPGRVIIFVVEPEPGDAPG